MYKLTNWYFMKYAEGVIAEGVVEGHRRLEDGTFIHTSLIEMVLVKEDRLLMETYSGSHYELLFEEIDPKMRERSLEALLQVKSPDKAKITEELFDLCVKLWEEKEARQQKKLEEILQPGELYMFTSGVHVQSAYFKKQDGTVIPVGCGVHVGTFQDSVLLRALGEVDFRFFPMEWNTVMEPYHWSDGLDAVIIENVGNPFQFVGTDRRITCERGTTNRIERKEYRGEGLMSPDCVNGKSIMLQMLSGESAPGKTEDLFPCMSEEAKEIFKAMNLDENALEEEQAEGTEQEEDKE